MLRYVECPRDSWQGFTRVIPTEQKVAYLQALLDAGFQRLDLGSFVSAKAVPQLADTEAVLMSLHPPAGADLSCIIGNERGLERALAAAKVSSVGYPLSVNDTFQRRNTNRSLGASWPLVRELVRGAGRLGFVVYLSMGFGNPYGEPWSPKDTAVAVGRLRELGVKRIALADTVGTATPERLSEVLSAIPNPETLGLHLHARADAWEEQLSFALEFGLSWFEGALAGVGGCPFADDTLVGNLPTERVLPWLTDHTGESVVPPAMLEGLAQRARELAGRFR